MSWWSSARSCPTNTDAMSAPLLRVQCSTARHPASHPCLPTALGRTIAAKSAQAPLDRVLTRQRRVCSITRVDHCTAAISSTAHGARGTHSVRAHLKGCCSWRRAATTPPSSACWRRRHGPHAVMMVLGVANRKVYGAHKLDAPPAVPFTTWPRPSCPAHAPDVNSSPSQLEPRREGKLSYPLS
jgi:hypothetical protein